MGSWNEMMILTTDLIEKVALCSGRAEVKGGKHSREPHGFPGNLWEAPPLQEKTVLMDRVNEAHDIQTRWGFLRKVAYQGELEEALG